MNDLLTIAPLLSVGLTAVAVLLSDAITPNRKYAPISVALAGLGITAWILLQQSGGVVTALDGEGAEEETVAGHAAAPCPARPIRRWVARSPTVLSART